MTFPASKVAWHISESLALSDISSSLRCSEKSFSQRSTCRDAGTQLTKNGSE